MYVLDIKEKRRIGLSKYAFFLHLRKNKEMMGKIKKEENKL